jgi:hypothetical protein
VAKVFIFSDFYVCTFPFIEFPLYNELKSRGVDIKYVLQKNDIRMSIANVAKEYSKLDLVVVDKIKNLLSISSDGDLFVLRFCYKGDGGKAAELLRNNKRKVLQYDVGGIDIRVRSCPAQYLTSKSENLKQAATKKFPGHYKNIFVTGALQYDQAYTTEVNRTEFLESYGFGPEKKLAIIAPANPGEAWMTGLKDTYKDIVKIMRKRCPEYQLAVKCHPLDYMIGMPNVPGVIQKGQHYNNKHSWEELFPDMAVIKAEEGYKALKACDLVINVRSSLAIEIPMFRKPLINVDRKKYVTNWPFDPKVMMDIEMEDLAYTLNSGTYFVDKKACEEYCKRENCADDGKAYVRMADIIVGGLK